MKDFKIYISLASILLLVYLIAEYNKPTPTNWSPTLSKNDKIPYGTYIAYHQLGQLFPQANIINTTKSVYSTLHDTGHVAGNYIIISKTATINKYDFNQLIKYIKAGNNAFISAFTFKGYMVDSLKLATSFEYQRGNATLSFKNKQLNRPDSYFFSRDVSNQYFSKFDTTKAVVISQNNYGHSTYLSFKFGRGTLYLCANPGIFTNYSLLKGDGADYAAKVLSYLPPVQNIYWDQYQNGDISNDESPLRVFFNNSSLQWAYYLSLFGIMVFILFEMKRRQRIIPVITPLANSTLDFVKVVGQVYFENRNNANIAHKKILYLLTYLRDEYQLRTTKFDTEFLEKLVGKLGLERTFANQLVNHLQYLTVQQHVSDHELIELNKLIEQFYIQSR